MLYFLGWSMDDPHITFRYLDHWVSGQGLAFNPGEPPLEGYSNFLWMLLLVPWRLLFGADSLMLGAQILGSVCALAVGPLLAVTWQRTGPPAKDAAPLWRWLPLYAWALSGPAMFWAVGGLETPLVALLITGTLFAAGGRVTERSVAAVGLGVLLVLLAMARPEGAMFGIALCAAWAVALVRRGAVRGLILTIVVFGAGTLAYQLWRLHTFGTLIPNTYWAKMGGARSTELAMGARHLLEVTVMTAGLPVIAWLGLWAWPRSRVIRLAALFAAVQIFFLVWVGGDWMPGGRFLVPALPCLILLLTAGLRRSWDGLTAVTRARSLRDLLILALMVWIGASLVGERYATREVVRLLRADELFGPVHEAIAWIEEHADPEDTVAGEEAGILPFATERRFLDLLAINDAHLARRPGALHEKMDVDYVVNQWRPDWVLLIRYPDTEGEPTRFHTWAGHLLGTEERFQARYTEVHQIPRQFGARVVRVYRRED
jgi:hypothetical protein